MPIKIFKKTKTLTVIITTWHYLGGQSRNKNKIYRHENNAKLLRDINLICWELTLRQQVTKVTGSNNRIL